MAKMLTYVDSKIKFSISLVLNFDDGTTEAKLYNIGDEVSLNYLEEKQIKYIKGILKQINSGNILVVDASTESNAIIKAIPADNIRKLYDIIEMKGTIEEIEPSAMISENYIIVTGEIPYVDEPFEGGNLVHVKVKAPEGIEDAKLALISSDDDILFKYSSVDPQIIDLYAKVTEISQVFNISIKWSKEALWDNITIVVADAVLLSPDEEE